MKKSIIISILIVMDILLTMTACVKNTDTPTFEPAETTSIVEHNTEATSVVSTEAVAEEIISTEAQLQLKVSPLTRKDVEKMTSKEVSNLFSELVEISLDKTLSSQDLEQIGYNFYITWRSVDFTPEQQMEFKTQSYEAFKNVYNTVSEKQIPLEELPHWTSIPVPDVLCKYFASDNFSNVENVCCTGIYDLDADDVLRVSTTIFENSVFRINSYLPCTIIHTNTSNQATSLAWEHLVDLSKSNYYKISEISGFTYSTCGNLYCFELASNNPEKLLEVAKNIMENDEFDFVEKYAIFINYNADMDINYIADMALKSLFEIAESADEETSVLIKEVASKLHDDEVAFELLSILEENS